MMKVNVWLARPGRDATMAKKTKKEKKAAVKKPAVTPAVQSVRSEAARRTTAGKFTKIIFNQIGGKGRRRPDSSASTYTAPLPSF